MTIFEKARPMTENRINTYEGMFLFPQAAVGDMQSAVDHLSDVLTRNGAEIISLQKWDERRLAYDIKGNKRGLYFLVYFNAPSTALSEIERACNLSEQILRSMMLRADHLTTEQIHAADRRSELSDEIKLRAEGGEEAVAAAAAAAATAAATASADDTGDVDYDTSAE